MPTLRKRKPRRAPIQARAVETCDIIFKAAAQILETQGERAFTTNRVAARAGISIGTLYQYFPNKQAILVALARREMTLIENGRDSRGAADDGVTDPLVRNLRRYIHALKDKPATRRAALKAILATATPEELARSAMATIAGLPRIKNASALDAFVLSRAVTGVVRAAVLENHPKLQTPEFERALLRLIAGYARMLEARAADGS